MESRTQITFPQSADFATTFQRWCGANGYSARESTGPTTVYQKGVGFLVAPMMLSVRQENGQVAMEAWIRCNLFTRITSFFILPAEMGIRSGGVKAIVPRKMARDAVNVLLQQLNVPLIP